MPNQVVRCVNLACGCSNLSGHQTNDKRSKNLPPRAYAYYLHLPRNRVSESCVTAIPAELLEDEIFSRLGVLLKDANGLVDAVRASMIKHPARAADIEAALAKNASDLKATRRRINNLVGLLAEQMGTASEVVLRQHLDRENAAVVGLDDRCEELKQEAKALAIPEDLDGRVRDLLFNLRGLNGYAPMFWSTKAKRALIALFLGGSKSTRFDRVERHVKGLDRGIFVAKAVAEDGTPFWTYEVRGVIGSMQGALTSFVELQEMHAKEQICTDFGAEALAQLAAVVDESTDGDECFRLKSPAFTPVRSSSARWSSMPPA